MTEPTDQNLTAAVVVTGHLSVDPERRTYYLRTCTEVVEQARATDGCLDFALSADLLDPGRINVLEVWSAREALDAFRGSGTGEEQQAVILGARVVEHDVSGTRSLT